MRTAIRVVLIISFVLVSIYVINDQWKKLKEDKNDPDRIRKPKSYSLEELQERKGRIMKGIEDR